MTGNHEPTDSFDEKAATWDDDPGHIERAKVVAHRITEELTIPANARLLEYGAGTGLVAEALQSQVADITLADTSAGMRKVLQQKLEVGRFGRARIWPLDLSCDPIPEDRFDLIITVLTLHHVHDLAKVLNGFAQLSTPGGQVCVVDLDKEDGSFHGEGFGGHHGFDRTDFAASLTAAGLSEVRVVDCHHITRDDGNYPMFLAIGTHS